MRWLLLPDAPSGARVMRRAACCLVILLVAAGCSAPCGHDTDCAPASYCVAGVCRSVQPDGTACTAANQCASNYCVDGYCCDTRCGGDVSDCQACSSALSGGADGK